MDGAQGDDREAQRLVQQGERIEQLLSEIAGMVGPPAFQRVEELMRHTVALYGAGLDRVLGHVTGGGPLDPQLRDRLCADRLVSSLLLLHGLHPLSTEARVHDAVAALGRQLASRGVEVAVTHADATRAALSVSGGAAGCAAPGSELARMLEQALQEAAPELAEIHVGGPAAVPADLVQIRLPMAKGPAE